MEEMGERIAEEARRWTKARVKYRHRGITMEGCDCSGFLVGVMRKLGYLLKYKLRYYPQDWNLHSGAGDFLLQEISKYAIEVPNSTAKPGDVLVFNFGKCDSHAGIMIGPKTFVHCYLTAKRVKVGVLTGSLWVKRWSKTYRWRQDYLKGT